MWNRTHEPCGGGGVPWFDAQNSLAVSQPLHLHRFERKNLRVNVTILSLYIIECHYNYYYKGILKVIIVTFLSWSKVKQ